jgi:hypothetical protein
VAARLAQDTDPDVERMQIEGWRRMTPDEKAAIVTRLTQTAFDLARAGVEHRHPFASAREQFLRMAVITLGDELARKAYPEIAEIDVG